MKWKDEVEETEDRERIGYGDEREKKEAPKESLRTLMQLNEMTTKRGEGERNSKFPQCI